MLPICHVSTEPVALLAILTDPARARQLLEGIPPKSAFGSFRLAIEAALAGEPAEPVARTSRSQQVFAVEVKGLPNSAACAR